MSSNEEANDGQRCRRRGFCKIPVIVAAIVLVKSALVLFLWNKLVPDLFHLPAIHYLQAIELTILARLLVGFGGPHRHFGLHHGHWRGHWMGLSSEEREKLREELRNRCEH